MTDPVAKAPPKTPEQLEADAMAVLTADLRRCGSSIPDLLHRVASQVIGNYPPPALPKKKAEPDAPPPAPEAVADAAA